MAKATKKITPLTGAGVKALRRKLKLNQAQFWGPLGVTQSGGSRYETERTIPRPVRKLLYVFYQAGLAADDALLVKLAAVA